MSGVARVAGLPRIPNVSHGLRSWRAGLTARSPLRRGSAQAARARSDFFDSERNQESSDRLAVAATDS